jgi:hypothetical protein
MPIVKLGDGRLVFIDAVPMDDATLAEIRAWGTPAILYVTNGYHRIDIHAFQEKLGVKVHTPADSAKRVAEKVTVDGGLGELPRDPALEAQPLVGVKGGEVVFVSRAPSGKKTLIFSDGIVNMHETGWLPRLIGFAGGPKTAPVFRMFFAKDHKGLRKQYEDLANLPDLGRLVMCHGDVIDTDAAAGLRQAAGTL